MQLTDRKYTNVDVNFSERISHYLIDNLENLYVRWDYPRFVRFRSSAKFLK